MYNVCLSILFVSFTLGTHELARLYVLEFTNVYTERGKIRVNFTHNVPGKPSESCVTSGLRMEGNELVPIESESLEMDTWIQPEVSGRRFCFRLACEAGA